MHLVSDNQNNPINPINSNSGVKNNSNSIKDNPAYIGHLSSLVSQGKGSREKATEYNKNLVRELNNIILASESEIQDNIDSLENDTELVEASLDMELIMQSYPELSLQVLSNLTEFFSSVLPANLMDIPWLENTLNLTHKISSLGGIVLASLANGSQLTAIICKHKMLKQSRKLLEKLETEFQKKLASPDPEEPPISLDAKVKTETVLKDWNKALKIHEKKLSREKAELMVSSMFNFLYVGLEVINWLPLAKISMVVERVLLLVANLGTQALIFVVHEIEFIKLLLKSVVFKDYQQSYNNWQKENLPVVKTNQQVNEITQEKYIFEEEILHMIKEGSSLGAIENKIRSHINTYPEYQSVLNGMQNLEQGTVECLNVMIERTKNLVHKRQAIAQKKVIELQAQLQAEPEKLRPKIETRNRFVYEQKLLNIHEVLMNPSSSPEEIEKILNDFVLFSENAQNASLSQAFQGYQEAVLLNQINEIEITQANLAHEFYAWMVNGQHVENQFQRWLDHYPTQAIRNYVDHQGTVQQTLKNALKEIVAHKQALENKFLNLNLFSKGSLCSMSLLCLGVSVGFIITGLLTTPMGGLGAILLITAIGPAVLGLGLMAINLLYQLHHKPRTTTAWTLPIKVSWNRIHRAFCAYRHGVKKKKLWDTAKVLRQLHAIMPDKTHSHYQKALDKYRKAKTKFEQSQIKIDRLTERLIKLERELAAKGWLDFVKHASLMFSDDPKVFDSLRAINESLALCDPDHLHSELKYLLEECGIDLATLQVEMKKDPQAIAAAVQSYAALDLEGMLELIKKS